MLDVGFSELLLIVVAAVIFIGPKDLPVVIRHIAKFFRQLQAMKTQVMREVKGVIDEVGLDDIKKTTIIDMDGVPQTAYDVGELKTLEARKHD